jgi:hypothetical protein
VGGKWNKIYHIYRKQWLSLIMKTTIIILIKLSIAFHPMIIFFRK